MVLYVLFLPTPRVSAAQMQHTVQYRQGLSHPTVFYKMLLVAFHHADQFVDGAFKVNHAVHIGLAEGQYGIVFQIKFHGWVLPKTDNGLGRSIPIRCFGSIPKADLEIALPNTFEKLIQYRSCHVVTPKMFTMGLTCRSPKVFLIYNFSTFAPKEMKIRLIV